MSLGDIIEVGLPGTDVEIHSSAGQEGRGIYQRQVDRRAKGDAAAAVMAAAAAGGGAGRAKGLEGETAPAAEPQTVLPEGSEEASAAAAEAVRLKEKGNSLFKAADYVGAHAHYSEAIRLDPSNFALFGNRAMCSSRLEQWDEAEKDARRAISLNASYLKGYHRLAQALIEQPGRGKAEEARAVAQEGLQQCLTDRGGGREGSQEPVVARQELTGGRSSGSSCSSSSSGGSGSGSTSSSGSGGMTCTGAGAVAAEKELRELLHRAERKLSGKEEGGGGAGVETAAAVERHAKRRPKTVTSGALQGLYDDKPETIGTAGAGEGLRREAQALLRKLKESATGGGAFGASSQHVLDGVFSKMLNREYFRKTIFPGLSSEHLQGAPQSFQALLQDPMYCGDLSATVDKALAKADSVLSSVKAKGAAVGDIMDAQTEETLKPQVLQEAFAREVVAMVRAIHARSRALAALEQGRLADPQAEEATWEQLDEVVLHQLQLPSAHCTGQEKQQQQQQQQEEEEEEKKGYAIQDGFLGAEWLPLLLENCERMSRDGVMQAVPERGGDGLDGRMGEMAWLEKEAASEAYPALTELLTNLHALPHELNAELRPSLGLCVPLQGSCMLHKLRKGDALPPRLDSQVGEQATGYRITAVYFIGGEDGEGWGEEAGGEIRLTPLSSLSTSASTAAGDGGGGGGSGDGKASASAKVLPDESVGGTKEGEAERAATAVAAAAAAAAATTTTATTARGGGGAAGTAGDGEAGEGVVDSDTAAVESPQAKTPTPLTEERTSKAVLKPLSKAQATPVLVDPIPDRLLLFQSAALLNERLALTGPVSQWALVFWMHGQSL